MRERDAVQVLQRTRPAGDPNDLVARELQRAAPHVAPGRIAVEAMVRHPGNVEFPGERHVSPHGRRARQIVEPEVAAVIGVTDERKARGDLAHRVDHRRQHQPRTVERRHHAVEQDFQRIQRLVEKWKPVNQRRIELKSDAQPRDAHGEHLRVFAMKPIPMRCMSVCRALGRIRRAVGCVCSALGGGGRAFRGCRARHRGMVCRCALRQLRRALGGKFGRIGRLH